MALKLPASAAGDTKGIRSFQPKHKFLSNLEERIRDDFLSPSCRLCGVARKPQLSQLGDEANDSLLYQK